VGTEWRSPELWLRRSFELDGADLRRLSRASLYLRIHHDEDAEVYLNGVPVATLPGYTTGYRLEALTPDAVRALREGLNVLAVHVSQTDGGQFIDAGIVEWREGRER